MDPETGETLVDELGRRSFTTSVAYGPTIGKNIALAYLPWAYCQEGRKLLSNISARPTRSKWPPSATSRSTTRRTSSRGADVQRDRASRRNGKDIPPEKVKTQSRLCRRAPALMPPHFAAILSAMVVPAFLRWGLTAAAAVASLGLAAARPAFAAERGRCRTGPRRRCLAVDVADGAGDPAPRLCRRAHR